jgi:hypothetical protein
LEAAEGVGRASDLPEDPSSEMDEDDPHKLKAERGAAAVQYEQELPRLEQSQKSLADQLASDSPLSTLLEAQRKDAEIILAQARSHYRELRPVSSHIDFVRKDREVAKQKAPKNPR